MKQFWTASEREAIKNIQSLEEAVKIACTVLDRMHQTGKPIVQICGPMTTGGAGSFRLNMRRFRKAITKAHEKSNYLVFDQMIFTQAFVHLFNRRGETKEYWIDLIDHFYGEIFRSGYFKGTLWLRDWESSTGARREHEIAQECNLFMEDYAEEWLQED